MDVITNKLRELFCRWDIGIQHRLRGRRDRLAGAIDQLIKDLVLGPEVVVHRLAPKAELGSNVVEISFTETLVREELLCGVQYLFTPSRATVGTTRIRCHSVGKVASPIALVA